MDATYNIDRSGNDPKAFRVTIITTPEPTPVTEETSVLDIETMLNGLNAQSKQLDDKYKKDSEALSAQKASLLKKREIILNQINQ